jgi:tRNA dimethylallyltransferase
VTVARSPRAVALVGVTAVGKSALAEAIADDLGAEIVCCDSRQVFRELDIGTGKPTALERAARPHHLFDTLTIGQRASAGWYGRAAGEALEAIHARGRLPLLVGGSGLYLRATIEGLDAEPPHDAAVRARIRRAMEDEGPERMHRRLAELDPEGAARLAPRDRQRIARALEVVESSGRPLSWWHRRESPKSPAASWPVIELIEDPDRLRARIAERTAWMFAHGLVEEADRLRGAGLGEVLRGLRAIGYDEALALLEGELTGEQAEARTNQRTAQLAKRQRTWFRHQVTAIRLDARAEPRVVRETFLAALESNAGAR